MDKTNNNPWYIEIWNDADLINVLEYLNLPCDDCHLEKLKKSCLHLFDDKSDRNQMIKEVAESIFDEEIKHHYILKYFYNRKNYGEYYVSSDIDWCEYNNHDKFLYDLEMNGDIPEHSVLNIVSIKNIDLVEYLKVTENKKIKERTIKYGKI